MKRILLGLGVIVIIIVTILLIDRPVNQPTLSPTENVMEADNVMMEKKVMTGEAVPEKAEEPAGAMMKKSAEMANTASSPIRLAGIASPLYEFDQAAYEQALQSNKLVALYFYANWCPTCKAEFPNMQKAFDVLSTDTVIGFRVNYKDSETSPAEEALAREFGIAYQHTKVFIRGSERLLKSPEQWTIDRYTQEINKALTQ